MARGERAVVGVAFGLLALATVVRWLFISSTMVLDDEAYYYVWTRHLAGGYVDGGPTIAYVNAFFVALFGATGFALRLGAVVLLTALACYLYWWGARRFNPCTGALLLGIVTCTPICFFSSIVHTYDTEMAAAMLAAIALYYDAFFVDRRAFYPGGIMLGVALLSKISVAFSALAIALLPWLVPETRWAWRRREYYFSFALAALFLLPFLYWNATHAFAFVRFKGGMAFHPGPPNAFLRVWGAQLACWLPILCGFAIALPCRVLLARRRRAASAEEGYFAWVAAFPLAFFAIGSCVVNYYGNWVAPAFFGGLFLTAIHAGRAWARYRLLALLQGAASVLGLAVLLGQLYWGFIPLRARADITNRYYCHSAIPTALKAYLMAHPAERNLRIVSDNYQLPSLVNFYLHPHPEALGLSLGRYHATLYSTLSPRLPAPPFLFLAYGDQYPIELKALARHITPRAHFVSRRQGKDAGHLSLWMVEQ